MDPRHDIFASLGLFESTERLLLPDYLLWSSEIFIRTAFEITKKEESVEYLVYATNQITDLDLPS